MSTLFDGVDPPAPDPAQPSESATDPMAPLAERMRPRTLDEVVGQDATLGRGTPLRRSIQRGHVPSMVFWGPPGCGKTTIARIIAQDTGAQFIALSAVSAGVADVRRVVDSARHARSRNTRTILFLDEIHRFNKAQQDALLPNVETGLVTLLGATTENPGFEVNAALLSRCRVAILQPLSREDVERVINRALQDCERGLAGAVTLEPDALGLLADLSGGDARAALSTLDMACAVALSREETRIDIDAVRAIAGASPPRHDKHGEQHFNVVSALIKSMRESDPDAAVYWLSRMVAAGESPMFIARRLVIFASEDVGTADSRALVVAVSAMQAAHQVGWPEAHYPLAHAAVYLSCAPRSNAVNRAMKASMEDVHESGALAVPLHLRNAPTKFMKNLGYGRDYQYPHDHKDAITGAVCMPDALADRVYFQPTDRGEDAELRERLREIRARKAQLRDGENAAERDQQR